MYGVKKIPFQLEIADTKISIEKKDNLIYKRESVESSQRKLLLSNASKVIINPIEPVMLPKEICHNLLIEFTDTVFLESGIKRKIYLNFPIEIGVFLIGKSEQELIDVFSFDQPKYSLYGDPRSGIVCRYFQSDVYNEEPQEDVYRKGVLTLNVENGHANAVEIKKVLFNAQGMKIFYNDKLVKMQAKMKILEATMAETEFSSRIKESNLQKAIELFTMRKLSIVSPKAVMTEGLS